MAVGIINNYTNETVFLQMEIVTVTLNFQVEGWDGLIVNSLNFALKNC